MANYYMVAGVYYPAELYHHGIKGQKWGVRRYQNDDGTLTAAGRERYGSSLGEHANEGGVLRRLATGDYALGAKRLGERREQRLKNKIEKREAAGQTHDKLDKQYEIQKARNIGREVYNSRSSTGKLLAQKLLLGEFGADSYRSARGRGRDIGEAATGAALGAILGVPIASFMYDVSDTKRQIYGKRG